MAKPVARRRKSQGGLASRWVGVGLYFPRFGEALPAMLNVYICQAVQ